jgi:hypothetical protein
MPAIAERSSSTLLPTMRPSCSATTPWNPGCVKHRERKATATSAFGKSGGKPCSALIRVKAA